MRFVLILLVSSYLPFSNCGVNSSESLQITPHPICSYEFVIRFFEYENTMDKLINVLNRNGLMITKMQQTYLSTQKQEIRIIIKVENTQALNEAECQVRSVVNVESISIIRL